MTERNVDRIDHIGIAVKSVDDYIPYYRDVLGLEFKGIEVVEREKVKTAMFQVGDGPTLIELLEPTDPDSAVGKFLASRGEGIHHICFGVKNVEEALQKAKEAGVQLIHETPFKGAGGALVAFLHPKSTGKVLTELSEGSHH